jgi:DNA-binding NarL/FixJ family response regulator
VAIKILIVEDNLLLKEALEIVLRVQEDFEIAGSCGSGEEALKFLEVHAVDMVILDRILPGINGVALTKTLKQRYPSMKVVMFSMIADEESVKRALEAGVDSYLPKEISLEKLVDALKKAQSGEKVVCYMITEKLIKIYT